MTLLKFYQQWQKHGNSSQCHLHCLEYIDSSLWNSHYAHHSAVLWLNNSRLWFTLSMLKTEAVDTCSAFNLRSHHDLIKRRKWAFMGNAAFPHMSGTSIHGSIPCLLLRQQPGLKPPQTALEPPFPVIRCNNDQYIPRFGQWQQLSMYLSITRCGQWQQLSI